MNSEAAKKHEEDGGRGLRSTIRLSNALILSLRQLNDCLALVFIMRNDATEKEGLIEYNFEVLKKAVLNVFAVHRSMRSVAAANAQRAATSNDDDDGDAEVDFVAGGSYDRDDDFSHEVAAQKQLVTHNGRMLTGYANAGHTVN